MADLLLYGAIKGQRDLLFPAEVEAGNQFDYSTNTSSEGPIPAFSGYPVTASGGNAWRAAMVESWSKAFDEYTAPKTNSICCADNYSGYYRCGANNCFCVPPGVSRVTFQLWGAGGGSSQNCCCGGAPAGVNGAYAVAVVDVCPGEVFCWCAGCAYCCCGDQDSAPGGYTGSCGTTVSYCGNPNGGDCAGGYGGAWCMCAPGSNGTHMCLWNCQVCKTFSGYSVQCNLALPSINAGECQSTRALANRLELTSLNQTCTVNSCSSCWSFCWDTQADDMYIPPIYGCRSPFTTCAEAVAAKNAIFTGYPTIYPEIQISCDMQTPGFTQPAPVYGFHERLMQDGTYGENPNASSFQCFNGSTCAGHCSNPDASGLCIPSLGATGSKAYGGIGATSCRGGRGRTGMICISWECD